MKYIFCDSDNGVTTPGTLYQTTSTWPANSDRWSSIANALGNATIQGLVDDLTFLIQGAANFGFANVSALSALSVLIEGNATGAIWDDTKATIQNSGTAAPLTLALSVPMTVRNVQAQNSQSSGTPRIAYCTGTGAVTLEGLKLRGLSTSTNTATGINGTTAPPASITAKNCIVDMSGCAVPSNGISLQTATVGNFYNCVFRGGASGAINPDNCVNCAFFGFATQGGSSGNYKYCATVNNTGTNPVTVSSWNDAFINYANFDYRLKTGSALIGAGIGPSSDASVPTTDIAGNTRSGTTTDVGAAMYTQILTITSVDGDDTVYDNQVVNIVGTGFGTVQGLVFIDGVQQSINSWSDTLINITVEQGALSLGANTLKVFKPI